MMGNYIKTVPHYKNKVQRTSVNRTVDCWKGALCYHQISHSWKGLSEKKYKLSHEGTLKDTVWSGSTPNSCFSVPWLAFYNLIIYWTNSDIVSGAVLDTGNWTVHKKVEKSCSCEGKIKLQSEILKCLMRWHKLFFHLHTLYLQCSSHPFSNLSYSVRFSCLSGSLSEFCNMDNIPKSYVPLILHITYLFHCYQYFLFYLKAESRLSLYVYHPYETQHLTQLCDTGFFSERIPSFANRSKNYACISSVLLIAFW